MNRSTKQPRQLPISERQIYELNSDPPFGSVGRQMNKMLDQMNKGYFGFHPVETWTPAVNLYETAESYLVCVDLAGVEKEKIDITVQGSRLTFKGNRPVPIQPEAGQPEKSKTSSRSEEPAHPHRVRVHLMEVDHGSFSRDVELPEDVESDNISATYRNGLLWIELPRKTS